VIIEIALGIVLAVFILRFAAEILTFLFFAVIFIVVIVYADTHPAEAQAVATILVGAMGIWFAWWFLSGLARLIARPWWCVFCWTPIKNRRARYCTNCGKLRFSSNSY